MNVRWLAGVSPAVADNRLCGQGLAMSELVAATLSAETPPTKVRETIDALQARGATVYAWALICRDQRGRIAVVDRMEKGAHAGLVAALIGALAGIAASPLGAIAGAVSGALVGLSAEQVNEQSAREFLVKLSRHLDENRMVLAADISPDGLPIFGEHVQQLGGAILPDDLQQRTPLGG
jgi:uncharacterized membrane protein